MERPLVLVHCGWPADMELVCRALGDKGVACRGVDGPVELPGVLSGDEPELFLADASSGLPTLGALLDALDARQEGRDVALVILADAPDAPLLADVLSRRPHATLLTKPVTRAQFEAAVQAGLRYRAERRAHHRLLAELGARVARRTAELERVNAKLREEAEDRRRAAAARTELLRRLDTAQEDERRRISRELHDGLGQELTALTLSLKALEAVVSQSPAIRDGLLAVVDAVNRVSREAHDLAVELRPTALDDMGLGSALAAYIARWTDRTRIAVAFEPIGLDGDRLPPDVETTVYRVVQEALNNVAKHAGAGHASVLLTRHGGELVALVEDDGRGFDPGRVGASAGRRSLGLLGIRERVGLVGGTLLIDSSEGEGTLVRIRIPLRRPAHADDGAG